MSNTGQYHKPSEILFNASAMAGDQEFKVIPRGFYMSLIQDAFRELNMASMFMEKRENFSIPLNLTIPLPSDCFTVENVYVFTGDECVISNSKKVYWKKNYYTEGKGYIANDKWNNGNDLFFHSRGIGNKLAPGERREGNPSDLLWYNIQLGNLMVSSSCLTAGNKIHIHYRSTGGEVTEAPIIPVFFKTAMEDFVTEAALRFRMANEPSMAKNWAFLQSKYEQRLDLNGMNGSWHNAKYLARTMNESQRNELATYLGRAAWGVGR